MLHAGEDFRFIARRIVIFSSEDVGLAAPAPFSALCSQSSILYSRFQVLAHATAYLCRREKSREAYEALGAATEEIESEQTTRVPERLKNKHFPVNPEE